MPALLLFVTSLFDDSCFHGNSENSFREIAREMLKRLGGCVFF